MQYMLSMMMQVGHLAQHDLEQARAVLVRLLRNAGLNDEDVLPMMALQAAGAYFAEAGRMQLAVDLTIGIPRRMMNLTESPRVEELAALVDTHTADGWSVSDLEQRLDRAMAEASVEPSPFLGPANSPV